MITTPFELHRPDHCETERRLRPPCISLRGITKKYKDHVALAPIDLDIREG